MFVTKTRDDGTEYTTLSDGAPEWLTEVVREAHDGSLPNDWVYSECRAAFEAERDESTDVSDWVHEHSDSQVDIYTNALYQWAADLCGSSLFAAAEEEANGMGIADNASIEDRLKAIQYCAIARIAALIAQAVEEHPES